MELAGDLEDQISTLGLLGHKRAEDERIAFGRHFLVWQTAIALALFLIDIRRLHLVLILGGHFREDYWRLSTYLVARELIVDSSKVLIL